MADRHRRGLLVEETQEIDQVTGLQSSVAIFRSSTIIVPH